MAKSNQLNVIPAFIGHGIGKYFHGPPEVLHFGWLITLCGANTITDENFRNFPENNLIGTMLPGMVFTIEPILSLGEQEIEILDDDWTAVTTDDSRSAQFEHTVLITDTGVDVLTI